MKKNITGLFAGALIAVLSDAPASADDIDIFAVNNATLPTPNVMFMFDFSASMNEGLTSGEGRIDALRGVFSSLLNDDRLTLNAGLLMFDEARGSGPDFPLADKDSAAARVDAAIPPAYRVADALISIVENAYPSSQGTPLLPAYLELGRYWLGGEVIAGDYDPPSWVNDDGLLTPNNGYYRATWSQPRRAAHPASYGERADDYQIKRCYTSCTSSTGASCNLWSPRCAVIPPERVTADCGVHTQELRSCTSVCVNSVDGECLRWEDSCGPVNETRDHGHCQYQRPRKDYHSPIVDACQSNHVVLLSDGAPSGGENQGMWRDEELRRFINQFDTAAPATPLASDSDTAGYCSALDDLSGIDPARVEQIREHARCAPELARLLNQNDLSATLPGRQNLVTHAIGFDLSAQPEARGFLERLTAAGGGGFYTADSGRALAEAFAGVLDEVTLGVDNASFTPPTLALDRGLRHRDVAFLALFEPDDSANWVGNVKGYRMRPGSTVLLDEDGAPATDADGRKFLDSARSLWSGAADGNEVAAGGLAGLLGVRNEGGARALTYTDPAAPSSPTALNNAFHELGENNPAISWEMLGLSDDGSDRRELLLRWARGVDAFDEDGDGDSAEPRRRLGAPLHSAPLLLEYPRGTVLFITTNEGFLHAFDTGLGVDDAPGAAPSGAGEVFAFMPQSLLANLDALARDQSPAPPVYGLDGALTAWHRDDNGNGVVDHGERAYLYFGMRRGGSSVFALDVSDLGAPRLAWRIDGGSGDFARLGQSWSRPQLLKVKTGSGLDGSAFEHLLAFAGGYDPAWHDDPAAPDGARQVDTLGNAVYFVDPESGALRWSAQPGGGANTLALNLSNSIPAELRAIDINDDGVSDRLYFGDSGGRVWRIDLSSAVPGSEQYAGQTLDDAYGYLLADLGGDGTDNRRFFYPPEVGLNAIGSRLVLTLAIGSGHRAQPLSGAVQDRLYLLDDRHLDGPPDLDGDGLADTARPPALSEAELLDVSSLVAPDPAARNAARGWYLRLQRPGEKSLATPLMFGGQLLFTTFTPAVLAEDAAACASGSPRHLARVYSVNAGDGSPLAADASGATGAEQRVRQLSTQAIPTTPVAALGAPSSDDPQEVSSVRFYAGKEYVGQQQNTVQHLFWRPRDSSSDGD